jgi:hypothetical protein
MIHPLVAEPSTGAAAEWIRRAPISRRKISLMHAVMEVFPQMPNAYSIRSIARQKKFLPVFAAARRCCCRFFIYCSRLASDLYFSCAEILQGGGMLE